MTVAATTSELYFEKEAPPQAEPKNLVDVGKPSATPPPPPSAPQPVKVTEPVTVKRRMADENPDGSVRDTSTEALRKGNEIQFRNVDDEALEAKQKEKQAKETEPAKLEETKPVETQPPAEPKKFAGKFLNVEELEKGYTEAQKKLQETLAERDRLQREATATASKPAEVKPAEETPEQVAAQREKANEELTKFVADPIGYRSQLVRQAQQETLTALAAQQMTEQWRKANPDLVEHEIRVAFEAAQLIQAEPALATNPQALFDKATANFRQFTGKLRTEGAKEALTQETRVIPLTSSTSSTETAGQPSPKTPMTADEAYEAHMSFLKSQEKRSHQGLRR